MHSGGAKKAASELMAETPTTKPRVIEIQAVSREAGSFPCIDVQGLKEKKSNPPRLCNASHHGKGKTSNPCNISSALLQCEP
eukprot:scaffold24_cov341-Pavlova_lutheri.AAC.44